MIMSDFYLFDCIVSIFTAVEIVDYYFRESLPIVQHRVKTVRGLRGRRTKNAHFATP
jgi:hypothetical protein